MTRTKTFPFPICKYVNSSAAIVFGIEVFSTDSKIVRAIYNAFKKVSDIKYWFMYRFLPEHKYHVVYTDLKPGYYDIDEVMLHACMKLLRRYVEDELHGVKEIQDWIDELKKSADNKDYFTEVHSKSQLQHLEDTLEIYNWWMFQRQKEWELYDKHLTAIYSGEMKWTKQDNDLYELTDVGVDPNAEWTPDQLHEYENSINQKEDDMLARLIKMRRSMWT